MMATRFVAAFYVFFGLVSEIAASEASIHSAPEGEKYAVVLARPAAVKFFSEIPPAGADEFVIGSLFSATLKVVEVMHGSLDTKRLKVVLAASHKEVLDSGKLIAVLIRITPQGVDVLY